LIRPAGGTTPTYGFLAALEMTNRGAGRQIKRLIIYVNCIIFYFVEDQSLFAQLQNEATNLLFPSFVKDDEQESRLIKFFFPFGGYIFKYSSSAIN
jgi:hypothetical protein